MYFVLSVLFCCLCFSGVFVCCLGGGVGRAQTAKIKTRPCPNSKMMNTPRPFRAFVFAAWAGGRVFFLQFGRVACFFCCLGGVRVDFLLFGRGAC